MSSQRFSQELRNRSDSLWSRILRHPFVQGIGDGSLDTEIYAYYLRQDYVYLIEFSRVFALASAKARDLKDMSTFAELLRATLTTEMDLHRRTCAGFGLTAADLEQTEPALVTTAYTSFLVKTCYEGSLADILSVLLPCAAGYVEIAQHLKENGLPSVAYYRDWIETYSSKEFIDFSRWLENRLDSYAVQAADSQRDEWYRAYLWSSRFELLFFEMAWSQERWPSVVPPTTGRRSGG
jgi:thiaminase/transcriptional activator TenA